ncbi:MAG: hypothetical protein QM774_00645 [Gordonia sp. (in: high G+C Gram-positive bacteria)]|uniref:DUF6542 domain-containing protein n=1 Tax=Gordonia sp. (in: high G+C Gram-positive bacteria) TaxID=84139 RepID=UPI0039E55D4C
MLSRIRDGAVVPVDQRSVLPTVRGVPWYGVIAIAAVPTIIGAVIDALATGSLGWFYNILFFLGSIAAALMANRKGLFTAAVQPPLVAAIIGLLTLFGISASKNGTQGLKSVVLKMALPFANTFPCILAAFVICVAIVLVRRYVLERGPAEAEKPAAGKRRPAPGGPRTAAAKAAPSTSGHRKAPAKKSGKKPGKKKPAATKAAAKKTTAQKTTAQTRKAAPQHTAQQPAAGQAERPRRSAASIGSQPVRRAQPQTIPPRQQPKKPRRTAGQIREQAHIEDLTAGLDD